MGRPQALARRQRLWRTRLGARVGSAHIAFDDHPSSQRFADRIDTVTVDSVFAWLERAGLAGGVQIVR